MVTGMPRSGSHPFPKDLRIPDKLKDLGKFMHTVARLTPDQWELSPTMVPCISAQLKNVNVTALSANLQRIRMEIRKWNIFTA